MAAFALESLQNFLRRNWMLRQPFFFTYWLPKLPVFWFITLFLTQSVRPLLATYSSLGSACVTYGTSCHGRGHQHFPPNLYRECYGFQRAFFTLRHFFTLNFSLLLSRPPRANSSPSRVAGLHADHRNIDPVWLLCRMTAIRKVGLLVGSICV